MAHHPHRLWLAGSSLAALLAATPAFAQTGSGTGDGGSGNATASSATSAEAAPNGNDQTIVITASKREQLLIDVPFSVNAQTEADIQRSGANTIEDLSRNVAGLTVQNLGPGQSQVSIRGVSAGQIVRDQPGVKEQVGVYLDESVISLSLFTPDLDLFDLNRVETLRGPQGTLFGSGSVGGTIRYITNQPRIGVSEGLVEGNVNLVDGGDVGGHIKGAVNVPMGDTAAARAVGYYTRYGGFIDNLGPGGDHKNVNDGSRAGGRLALLFQPSPGIKITPRVVYQQIRANGFNREEVFNLFANPFTTTRPKVNFKERQQYLLLPERFSDDTFLADLTGQFALGSRVQLTSVTSYINRDILASRDASALTGSVSVDLGYPAAAVTLPSNLRDTTKLKQWSQEVRLSSTGSGPFQWVIGAFYSNIDRFYRQRLPTPGYDAFTDARFGAGTSVAVANGFPLNSPYNSDLPYKIKQKAVFGEGTYDFGR
ncbi:MAG: iron complex outerrane recepter protein, partial [Sphingomonadales bacterium]|nr:iron complex outerrane recepter protein [Sphingomonadales bacterium]